MKPFLGSGGVVRSRGARNLSGRVPIAGPIANRALSAGEPRIQLAVEVMRHECGRALTVAGVGKELGLSASRLEHLLKTQTGHTFSATLREVRLLQARALLGNHALRVKEVAALVGYSSVPTFSRNFRRHFGQSPSRYRHSRFG